MEKNKKKKNTKLIIYNLKIIVFSIESLLKEELSQDILTSTICYELGLSDYYAKNWFSALNHFKKSFILINDGPSKAMMKRCETMLEIAKINTIP